MEPDDSFSYDKCTCSKTGMSAFQQVYLSYEKLSYVKIAHVNGPANKFDKFH